MSGWDRRQTDGGVRGLAGWPGNRGSARGRRARAVSRRSGLRAVLICLAIPAILAIPAVAALAAVPAVAFAAVPAVAVGAAEAPAGSAVILQYERIGAARADAPQTPLEDFEHHLDYLAREQYAVWPVEKVAAHLRHGLPLPERCVAITFDGGHGSVYDTAFPLLRTRGWPFSVFLDPESIDLNDPESLSWGEIREMYEFGVKFGPLCGELASLALPLPGEGEEERLARARAEIGRGRIRLFDELGRTDDLFAYALGEYDAALRALALEMKLSGLGLHPGPVGPGSDLGALPRFALSGDAATLAEFAKRVRSLPFPLREGERADPLRARREGKPVLRLALAPGDYDPEALAGSVRGPDDLIVRWVDRDQGLIELVARDPLPPGRSVYTLMAPHVGGGRYYWHSQLWIAAGAGGW